MSKKTPSLAIAVPIGAWHPLLRDCLSSLAVQTPPPVLSVLDASGDPRTASVIDKFASRIAYRRAGRDAGQAAAILEGWAKAPGDLFGWLNADDALYPGAIEAVAAHFASQTDTDVLYGHSVIINDAFETVGYHWAVEEPSDALLSGCIISQPSCFFRKAAYERAGGLDASLHYTMDWDLWTRLWASGARFRFVDKVLSRVLWTREAKTGGFGRGRRRELTRIIDTYNPPLRRLKSRIGFSLHHALEYVAPKGAAAFIRSARPARRSIHGLGRNGEIADEAFLPIVHYGQNATSLKIAMQINRGSVAIGAGAAEKVATESGITILPVFAPPGSALEVRFRAAPGASARLVSAILE